MHTFKQSLKLFYKNVFLSASYILFNLVIIIFTAINFNIYRNSEYGALDYIQSTLYLSIFVFIFFTFISYEYFYKLKSSNFYECLSVTNKGLQSFYFNGFLVMLIQNVITTAILTVINISVYFSLNINHTDYLKHIILNMLLNFFAISIVGILLGMVAAIFFKRLKAYLFLTIFILISTVIGKFVAEIFASSLNINLFCIYDLFNVFPPNLDFCPISLFGFSILPYRVELILFWVCFLSALILFKLFKNKKTNFKAIACIFLIISIVNIVLFYQPSSKVLMTSDAYKGDCFESFYYNERKPKIEKPNFNITNYKLDFKIKKELKAKVVLTVDKSDLPEYKFSLFHTYRLNSVTDEDGTPLKFTQDSDYINVKNNSNKKLNKIIMIYEGSSPKFYSNTQGASLPGYFSYYPQSGYYKLYDLEYMSYTRPLPKKPVDFDVTVKSNNKIYCNLPQLSDGTYKGKSTGLTIVSGFLDSISVDGVEVIYPYLEYTEKEIKDFVKENKENGVINKNTKKVIAIATTNLFSDYERVATYTDHMTLTEFLGIKQLYEGQLINVKKRHLNYLVETYINNRKEFEKTIKYESENLEEISSYYTDVLFAKKIDKLGDKYVIQKSKEYIENDNDERTVNQFLEQLN